MKVAAGVAVLVVGGTAAAAETGHPPRRGAAPGARLVLRARRARRRRPDHDRPAPTAPECRTDARPACSDGRTRRDGAVRRPGSAGPDASAARGLCRAWQAAAQAARQVDGRAVPSRPGRSGRWREAIADSAPGSSPIPGPRRRRRRALPRPPPIRVTETETDRQRERQRKRKRRSEGQGEVLPDSRPARELLPSGPGPASGRAGTRLLPCPRRLGADRLPDKAVIVGEKRHGGEPVFVDRTGRRRRVHRVRRIDRRAPGDRGRAGPRRGFHRRRSGVRAGLAGVCRRRCARRADDARTVRHPAFRRSPAAGGRRTAEPTPTGGPASVSPATTPTPTPAPSAADATPAPSAVPTATIEGPRAQTHPHPGPARVQDNVIDGQAGAAAGAAGALGAADPGHARPAGRAVPQRLRLARRCGGRRSSPGPVDATAVPAAVTGGGPVQRIGPGTAVSSRGMPAEDHRAHLRRRPRPGLDAADPRRAGPAPRARHLLPGRLPGQPAPGASPAACSPRATRSARTPSPTSTPATTPAWRLGAELTLTDNAIAAATGRRPVLLRPPYSLRARRGDRRRVRGAAADRRRPATSSCSPTSTPRTGGGPARGRHRGGRPAEGRPAPW